MDIGFHTVDDLLREASQALRDAGIDSPRLDAELLLAKASGCSRTELLTHPDRRFTEDIETRFRAYLTRRAVREPLPYITGERPFYDLVFKVTSAVLIPRQETEFLVEASIRLLKSRPSPLVIDIGVGSGAIAITIAHHVLDAVLCGTDTSADALEVAETNAKACLVSERTDFREGDMFAPFDELKFDLVVSNPPYIPSNEIAQLQPEVALYEPHQALDGGPDGLDSYRKLLPDALRHLKPNGVWL